MIYPFQPEKGNIPISTGKAFGEAASTTLHNKCVPIEAVMLEEMVGGFQDLLSGFCCFL